MSEVIITEHKGKFDVQLVKDNHTPVRTWKHLPATMCVTVVSDLCKHGNDLLDYDTYARAMRQVQ